MGRRYSDESACAERCACCSRAEPNSLALGVLAFSLTLSFLLVILAGALESNWLPMLNLIAVVFLPVVTLLGDALGARDEDSGVFFDEGKCVCPFGGRLRCRARGAPLTTYLAPTHRAAWRNLGTCFFGLVCVSMFGLPLVLLHAVSYRPHHNHTNHLNAPPARQPAPTRRHAAHAHPTLTPNPNPKTLTQQAKLSRAAFGYWVASSVVALAGSALHGCLRAGDE